MPRRKKTENAGGTSCPVCGGDVVVTKLAWHCLKCGLATALRWLEGGDAE